MKFQNTAFKIYVVLLILFIISFNIILHGLLKKTQDRVQENKMEVHVIETPGEPKVVEKKIVEEIVIKVNTLNYELIPLPLPSEVKGDFKTYMDYKTITNKTSKQWALQQLCETNEDGFRIFNGKYVVAVGTFYAQEVGKELIVTLESGKKLPVIVGDIKMNKHTNESNQYIPFNGNIMEFIIDKEVMSETPLKLGNVSVLGLQGAIISIEEVCYDRSNIR